MPMTWLQIRKFVAALDALVSLSLIKNLMKLQEKLTMTIFLKLKKKNLS